MSTSIAMRTKAAKFAASSNADRGPDDPADRFMKNGTSHNGQEHIPLALARRGGQQPKIINNSFVGTACHDKIFSERARAYWRSSSA
jgi:hypothetical protein